MAECPLTWQYRHENQFLVAESGSFNADKKNLDENTEDKVKEGGQIFRVTVTPGSLNYKVAPNPEDLPGISPFTGKRTKYLHPRIFNQSLENYEGLACWQKPDGKYIVLLGERGATSPQEKSGQYEKFGRDKGTLQWAEYDANTDTYVWKGLINDIHAEGMHSTGDRHCWRDISGLHIDKNRKIWATAAYDSALDDKDDPCNNPDIMSVEGRAYSVVYQLGSLCEKKGDPTLPVGACTESGDYPRPVRLSNFTIDRVIDSYKVEAIAAPQGSGNSELTIASEDEGGGSWWNRR